VERRKFIKYSSLISIGAGMFPVAAIGKIGASNTAQLAQFSVANTQIRHGALNLPFAKFLKAELPFDWLMDVHQNIFLKDGFQRNEAEDMNVMSIALKQEDHFEALQINIQADELNFLWKDQMVSINTFDAQQPIEISDDKYTFSLLGLEADQDFQWDQKIGTDYFVQVLAGEVQFENYTLTTTSGLGLVSTESSQVLLRSKEKSKVLVIRHAQD